MQHLDLTAPGSVDPVTGQPDWQRLAALVRDNPMEGVEVTVRPEWAPKVARLFGSYVTVARLEVRGRVEPRA